MPTSLKRYNVTFPRGLDGTVERDAERNRRTVSSQVIWILEQYYAAREKEAELFTPAELGEAAQRKAPVFETKHKPDAGHLEAIRNSLGRDES